MRVCCRWLFCGFLFQCVFSISTFSILMLIFQEALKPRRENRKFEKQMKRRVFWFLSTHTNKRMLLNRAQCSRSSSTDCNMMMQQQQQQQQQSINQAKRKRFSCLLLDDDDDDKLLLLVSFIALLFQPQMLESSLLAQLCSQQRIWMQAPRVEGRAERENLSARATIRRPANDFFILRIVCLFVCLLNRFLFSLLIRVAFISLFRQTKWNWFCPSTCWADSCCSSARSHSFLCLCVTRFNCFVSVWFSLFLFLSLSLLDSIELEMRKSNSAKSQLKPTTSSLLSDDCLARAAQKSTSTTHSLLTR